MIRMLLVDDHKIVRDGVRALFYDEEDIKIVGECSDGDEVLNFLKKNVVDVILMDIKMANINGIEATKKVVRKFPGIKVIALTMHDEEQYLKKIINAGAQGCVLKSDSKEELIKAIRKMADSEHAYFTQQVSQILISNCGDGGEEEKSKNINPDDLTKREIEVIKLIAEENTNNEIGLALNISPRTVDTHRRNLLLKLGVKNTAGLVKFAINQGLLDI